MILTTKERAQIFHMAYGTMQKAADAAGVSIRTMRRWKNEGVEPTAAHKKTLIKRTPYAKKLARVKSENLPRAFPMPLLTHRRKLREYKRGKWTGKYIYSEWVNYDVRHLRIELLYKFLLLMRDAGKSVQLIYETDKGRGATDIMDMTRMSDMRVEDWLVKIIVSGRLSGDYDDEEKQRLNRMIYIGVLEDMPDIRQWSAYTFFRVDTIFVHHGIFYLVIKSYRSGSKFGLIDRENTQITDEQ